jgi:hypothetical protein
MVKTEPRMTQISTDNHVCLTTPGLWNSIRDIREIRGLQALGVPLEPLPKIFSRLVQPRRVPMKRLQDSAA